MAFVVDRRPMGVAVDHAGHAGAREQGIDRGLRHVADDLGGSSAYQLAVARLARRARLRGESEPCLQRLGEELCLPAQVPGLRAELLLGDVVGTQQVAVQDYGGRAVQVDDQRFVEQGHAAAACIVRAEQEVAIAADEVSGHTRCGE